jgi:hypothetical protein
MTLPPIWSPNQGSVSWWSKKEKGGLIRSQPSHFHEMFVDNDVIFGHQAKKMDLNYFLEAQEKKIKINKAKNKRQCMGYETIAFMTRCNSPSTKEPTGKTLHFLVITFTPCQNIYPMPPHTLTWFGLESIWETLQT